MWLCYAFRWQDMNVYFVFSALTSRLSVLQETNTGSVFMFVICTKGSQKVISPVLYSMLLTSLVPFHWFLLGFRFRMMDTSFLAWDTLPQEAHISRVILVQKFREDCFLFLCASVSICGIKSTQVLEHPRSSVLIMTLPWPRDRVEHNLSLTQPLYRCGRCCKAWLLCKCNHSSSFSSSNFSFFSPCYPSSKFTYIHSSFTIQPEQMSITTACWLLTFNKKNSVNVNCCNHMLVSAILE